MERPLPSTLDGADGDDGLIGGAGADTLTGGDGLDGLGGGPGDDEIDAGPGNDTIGADDVPDGGDRVDGGPGRDTVDYSPRGGNLTIDLTTTAFTNGGSEGTTPGRTGDSLQGIENAIDGYGSSVLVGTDGPNRLDGEFGDDVIRGLGGDDLLDGGSGADTIDEGPAPNGADIISGGYESDVVDYSARSGSVVATLPDGADDGEAGEGDNLAWDVEDLRTGSGDDRLVGVDGWANVFAAGPGNDTIDVRSADGRDTEPDVVACGGGADSVRADDTDGADAECETVARPSDPEPPPLGPGPGPAPRLPEPPRVIVTIGAPSKVARDGTLTMRVACTAACGGGHLRLRTVRAVRVRKGAKPVRLSLGSARVDLPNGGRAVLKLKLSAKQLAMLTLERRVDVRAMVSVEDARRTSAVAILQFSLRGR